MPNGGAQHAELVPDSVLLSLAPLSVIVAEIRCQLGDGPPGEELSERYGRISDAIRSPYFRGALAHVVCENVGHERFGGVTGAGAPGPRREEFCERDFSSFAICRASAALAAAAAFAPYDVVPLPLFEPAEPWPHAAS
jgi:hypothetical protein